MEYREDDLRRVQKAEIEILSDVIRVCEENGLSYFAYGGTALGAVRHNGFIPWDDDIDIGMLREDYEKFLEIAPKKLKKGFTVQHYTMDQNAPAYFAKVRMDGTRFVEKNMCHLQIHQGIFIDIFPFDSVPKNTYSRIWHHIQVNFWQQLYLSKSLWAMNVKFTNKLMNITAKLSRFILHILLFPIPKSFLYRKLDWTIQKYNNTEVQIVSPNEPQIIDLKKSELLPSVMTRFETIQIAIPADADKMLKLEYGDYMVLPPEEKRANHMPIELKF